MCIIYREPALNVRNIMITILLTLKRTNQPLGLPSVCNKIKGWKGFIQFDDIGIDKWLWADTTFEPATFRT